MLLAHDKCFENKTYTAKDLVFNLEATDKTTFRDFKNSTPTCVHSSAHCLALRTKYRYAPTLTKLITTPITFQTITGREAINKP